MYRCIELRMILRMRAVRDRGDGQRTRPSYLIGILHGTVGHFDFVEENRLFHPLGTRLRAVRVDEVAEERER